MIEALALLLVFQLAGEVLAALVGLPLPGPVLGLVMLAGALALRPRLLGVLRSTALGLLQHLSLLFVPAGVGVMVHAQRLSEEGLAVVVAVVVSTVLAIAATGLTVAALMRRERNDDPGGTATTDVPQADAARAGRANGTESP